MKTIKIFVASSDELSDERRELADMVTHLNYALNGLGINIVLVKWEYLDASMGISHKQDEYNEELKDCEICMVMYWTKFGMYTESELNTAYSRLKAGNNPRKLYVYFKESDREMTPELKAFRDSFPSVYGHFHCVFRNEDALKSHFLLQFIDFQNSLLKNSGLVEMRDSKVMLGGKPFADLKKVDFVGNNDEYNQLLNSIKKTRKLLAITDDTDPEYSEYAQELQELLKRQQEMEDNLWHTALTITRLSNTASSERLQRAIELFRRGDHRGANAILDEDTIDRDIDRNLTNLRLSKEGLKNNIAELQLKIDVTRTEHAEGWYEKVGEMHRKIVHITEEVYGKLSHEHAIALMDAVPHSLEMGLTDEAKEYGASALDILTSVCGKEHPDTAHAFDNLGAAYHMEEDYDKALDHYLKALKIKLNIYSEMHPDVATSYNNIGSLLNDVGELEEALAYHEEALKIRVALLGKANSEVALSYGQIANTLHDAGDLRQALEYYEKALDTDIRCFGEKHLEVALRYNNIGTVHFDMEEPAKAMDAFQKAYSIFKETLGENHPHVATCCNNIGNALNDLGDLKLALYYYDKALGINMDWYGDNHTEVASNCYNIATVYDDLDEPEKALEFLEVALEIYTEQLGDDHPDTLEVRDLIDEIQSSAE